MANAGIDQSNLDPSDHDAARAAAAGRSRRQRAALKARLDAHYAADIGVVISDSVGRAWRLGTVGLAIGAAGVPSLWDRRGENDMSGRPLEVTEVAFADAVAAAAVLVMGEGAEGRPAALVRGLDWSAPDRPATALVRPKARICFDERRGSGPSPQLCRAVRRRRRRQAGARTDACAAAKRLTVVVNTGDDFEHLGLHVSPDIDTVLYTLAGLVNPRDRLGPADETWTFMAALEALGGPTWFNLGDGDLAMHVERTRRLRAGETLSAIGALARRRSASPRASCR